MHLTLSTEPPPVAQVAVARLRRLPVLEDFPVAAVPRSPYPNDSELYNAIRCGAGLTPATLLPKGVEAIELGPNLWRRLDFWGCIPPLLTERGSLWD